MTRITGDVCVRAWNTLIRSKGEGHDRRRHITVDGSPSSSTQFFLLLFVTFLRIQKLTHVERTYCIILSCCIPVIST